MATRLDTNSKRLKLLRAEEAALSREQSDLKDKLGEVSAALHRVRREIKAVEEATR